MKAERIISLKEKKNAVTMVIEVKEENVEVLKKEIKKAIRKWNHLLGSELSYKIIILGS